ncbi:uncharacterized protein B0H18DRAFT_951600 [Fomitopsis serialis]|uniref:uncharacterized protein n=1 Tax=Fomitopsis serialis TaxID=139415 RepID=UPI00200720EE|nr:uncharacterized protein B0H18DRAFT_951600 [Neoantrodia serialis]KAH9934233.1 hypothetical protein B0H18DRAFT_951600 [Neoantrodia serialis]
MPPMAIEEALRYLVDEASMAGRTGDQTSTSRRRHDIAGHGTSDVTVASSTRKCRQSRSIGITSMSTLNADFESKGSVHENTTRPIHDLPRQLLLAADQSPPSYLLVDSSFRDQILDDIELFLSRSLLEVRVFAEIQNTDLVLERVANLGRELYEQIGAGNQEVLRLLGGSHPSSNVTKTVLRGRSILNPKTLSLNNEESRIKTRSLPSRVTACTDGALRVWRAHREDSVRREQRSTLTRGSRRNEVAGIPNRQVTIYVENMLSAFIVACLSCSGYQENMQRSRILVMMSSVQSVMVRRKRTLAVPYVPSLANAQSYRSFERAGERNTRGWMSGSRQRAQIRLRSRGASLAILCDFPPQRGATPHVVSGSDHQQKLLQHCSLSGRFMPACISRDCCRELEGILPKASGTQIITVQMRLVVRAHV